MTRRYLAVHLPRFPTDRLARRRPELRTIPFATWEARGSARLLAAVCATAANAGLRPGLPLADATAMLPALTAIPADPVRERAGLEGLAGWALRFTPLAAAAPPDGLVLDITGCAHLWGEAAGGDEAALAADLAARLETMDFTAWIAIASTPLAALVLARAGGGRRVAAGDEERSIAALPVDLLRLDAGPSEALARLGIRRIDELTRQPRGPLARRIGGEALARLDEACGRLHRPITPVRPVPQARTTLDFPEPLISAAPIGNAVRQLLVRLTEDLASRGQGARRLELACFRVDGSVQRLGLGTARAARDAVHLQRLFEQRLDRIEPRFGIDRMVLSATVTEPLEAEQAEWPGREAAPEELARLVDRLSQRLRVRRLAPVLSHWPERAVRSAPPLAPVPVPSAWAGRVRPVQLLQSPEPVRVEDDRLLWRGRDVALLWREGPERLEPEWWRATEEVGRDYWQVETEHGARLWLFATHDVPARWFLHGHLA